jgi:hypothetical protein
MFSAFVVFCSFNIDFVVVAVVVFCIFKLILLISSCGLVIEYLALADM